VRGNGGLGLGARRFRGLVPRGARAVHRGCPVRKPRNAPAFTGRDRAGILVIRVSLEVRNGGPLHGGGAGGDNYKRAVSLAITPHPGCEARVQLPINPRLLSSRDPPLPWARSGRRCWKRQPGKPRPDVPSAAYESQVRKHSRANHLMRAVLAPIPPPSSSAPPWGQAFVELRRAPHPVPASSAPSHCPCPLPVVSVRSKKR
jgi:hypothetical protein